MATERIAFGTAGLRAAFGPGHDHMNNLVVLQTAQGLVRALQAIFSLDKVRERGVVIGYDHRASPEHGCSSLSFALHTAGVFLSQNVKVYLFDDYVHTPLVPYSITKLGCVAGCMITASHNPKEDAGFKLYADNGCQIVSPMDDKVQASILKNLDPWPEANALIAQGENAIRARCINPRWPMTTQYVTQVSSLLCRRRLANSQSKPFCYTAMHGVGLPYAQKVFDAFGFPHPVIVQAQAQPDFRFPSVKFPNPEEKDALNIAMQVASEAGCGLILANDPDADRLAVAEAKSDGSWTVFTGDEIAMLLADWEITHYKGAAKPAMVVSAVSSRFLGTMGPKRGVRVDETLTGFKWIGNRVAQLKEQGYEVLLSYEEAIGFCVGTTVFDKDGVSAAAVFAEMTWALYEQGQTCLSKLTLLRNEYGHFISRNGYIKTAKPQAFFDDVRNAGRYPFLLGKRRVVHVRDLQRPGGVDTRQPDLQPILPKTSLMITFELDDASTITLRASGTEPKLKYYVEGRGDDPAEVNRRLNEILEQAVLKQLLRLANL